MKGLLEVKNGLIKRNGPLSFFESQGLGILVNPSEVLAKNDEVKIYIERDKGIITDQAYTKILSRSNVRIYVKIIANVLYYFPHPIIFYNKANAKIETEIYINDFGKIVKAYVLGRKFHNEEFKEGDIKSITKVYYKEKLLIYDIFRVKNEDYKSKNIMGSEALLTILDIKNEGEYDFKRLITSSEKIDSLWREETKIWF